MPALNPFEMSENALCRKTYSKEMCARSLEILNRTVSIGNHPDRTDAEVDDRIRRIREAAFDVLNQPA